MLRLDGDHAMGNEAPSVLEAKDNEEVKLEGEGDVREDGVMTKAVAVSHPVVEYSARSDCVAGTMLCRDVSAAVRSSEPKVSRCLAGT